MPESTTHDVLIDDSQEQPAPAEQPSAKNGNGNGTRRPRAFSRRLAFAFAAVAAFTALLAGVLLSMAWTYQFNAYVHDNLQAVAGGIATIVQQTYTAYGFSYATLERIPMVGITASVGVQILDAKDELVYDEASMRQHMQSELQGTTGAQAPQIQTPVVVLQPSGQVVTAPIVVSGKRVGTVRVWAYGTQALLTDRDTQFRRGSLMGLALAGLVAVAFSGVAGIWYASRLVRPIERITRTAQALQNGEQDARTGLHSDDELGFLGKTFDAMADSIEADRAMERRLTADVAHELRTPLQAIQATVEAMQDGVLPADEERLGIVREETRRLSRLTDGILELTRLERGSTAFDMRRIDVAAPVHMAVDSLEPLIETCALTLSTDIAEHIYIEGDRDRLQQAVGNLLSNSARYTPADGHVEVRLRRDGDSALIEVADTGVGIADEDMARVFSRFWRADNARATATGGSGIGLAVTKEIVERHGGSITVAHREGGVGTVFSIRLPLA
ncbi:MAG TPA: HAMP domain-containing sensor histidine kinase [Coriobacteriia bacterium]